MKKICLILTAVFAVIAVSCNKEVNVDKVSGESVIRTFTCAIGSDVDSKMSIPDNGKAEWEAGDQIYIHGKYFAESITHTLTAGEISADGKKATFTVDLAGVEAYDPDGYYACYPASAVEYFSSSSKSYYYGEFNNTNNPLMSAYLDGSTFRFYNICGVLTFKVSGDFDEYIFTGNNGEVLGYSQYQVKIVSNDKNYARTANGPLTSLRAPVTSDGSFVNKVCFPNGVELTKGFTIMFLKSGSIVKTVSTKETYSVNIARGKLLPLGDITGKLKTYEAPASHEATHPAITGAADLGSTETANCYVVDGSDASNANKVFKFEAVQGNGATPVGIINDVVLLWETYNTSDAVTANSVIKEVDFNKEAAEDEYWITFKMPSTLHAGNAVIAAKDAGGSILWSWHIWVPSVSVSTLTGSDYTDFIGGGIMNMNLGAIEEVPATGSATIGSLGLLYQWGRKDPFVGAAEWKEYPAKAAVSGASWSKKAGKVSMDVAIKNPTTLYIDSESSDDHDWISTSSETLWGSSKTVNDPCPAGYKVPSNTGAESIWTKSDTGWTIDVSNHVCEHTASGVRIPLAGYVECYGGSLYGSGGGAEHTYVWSATHHDTERGKCMYIRASKAAGERYYKAYRGKGNAGSIRCIAE